MKEVNLLQNRISIETFCLGILGLVGCLIFKQPKVSLGLMAGTLTSILNFKLLAVRATHLTRLNSTRPLSLPRGKRIGVRGLNLKFFTSFLFRYGIIGLILWVAINRGLEIFFGVCAGLFMVQAAIYLDTFLISRIWKI